MLTDELSDADDNYSPRSESTLSDKSPSSPPLDSDPSHTTTKAAPASTPATAAFNPKVEHTSLLPIFRQRHIKSFTPDDDMKELSKEDDAKLTFHEWLDYFLRWPAYSKARRALFTDQQYIDLLHSCQFAPKKKVSEVMEGRPEKDTVWVRSQLSHNTFRHLSMKYTVADGECDTGYVLVSFKEMSAAGKGEVFARRLPTSVTPLSFLICAAAFPTVRLSQHSSCAIADHTASATQARTRRGITACVCSMVSLGTSVANTCRSAASVKPSSRR